tara:strand:+ start:3681 stop:4004 length:324 start_codon:yes stop_codon:yes gene_type:complete
MPIYEYRCDNCSHELETIQKVSEAPLRKCPECGGEHLVKKVSAAGFRLKGGGWYETDFKSGKKRNVSEKGSDSDNKASSLGSEKKDKDSSKEKKETTNKGKSPKDKK